MKSKLTYKPPHYHKLKVPYLAGGRSWAKNYPKSNITPSHTYSHTPDYVYNQDSDMLLSALCVSTTSNFTETPHVYDDNFIIINKTNLHNILSDAYCHTNAFHESSHETPSDSTETFNSSENNSSESHDSTSTESISPAPEYFTAQYGDTLWKIAKKYHTTVDAIVEANKNKPTERGFAQIKDKDLIYAGASYYLPSNAYIDTPGNNQNSTSSKSTSYSTQDATKQNGSEQFYLIGSNNDPLRFFRTSEEIASAKNNDQKLQPSQNTESSADIEPDQFKNLSSNLINTLPNIIDPITKSLSDNALSDLTDSELVLTKKNLYDLIYKYYFHTIEPDSFILNSETTLQTLADTFDCDISSFISANPDLRSILQQNSKDIEKSIIPENTVITIPIVYYIDDNISSLEKTSQQNLQNLSVPNYSHISFNDFSQYIQPYNDSKSLENLGDTLSAEDLITIFKIPKEVLYYLYDYVKDDPTINIDDSYEFTPNSNKLFHSINITSSINSSFADAYVDFHFISSPWLQKHLRPNVYKAFMYVINSFANGDYQHTHPAYTYISRPDEDKSTVQIRDLSTYQSISLESFDEDRKNAITNRTFGSNNTADTESDEPWYQYVDDQNNLSSLVQGLITYYTSIGDTDNATSWQDLLDVINTTPLD